MITNFKIFEAIHELPKVGDYIIVNNLFTHFEKIQNYVGKVTKVQYSKFPTIVQLHAVFNGNFKTIADSYFVLDILDVEHWSENEEELKTLLKSKKYNL